MSWLRVRAMIRKEILQISRDPRSLAFLIFLPAFMLVLYGFVLNFDVKHLSLGVLDQDRSPESRALIERFAVTEYFDLVAAMDSPDEVNRLIDREKIKVGLVIPAAFSEKIADGRNSPVQVIIDGTDASSASTAMGYVAAILADHSLKINAAALARRGLRVTSLPVVSRTRVWFNPELRSARFLLPGLMAFILMTVLVTSTSFAVVREKERGTMEQILVSPLKPAEMITAKVIPYVFISLVSAHLILLAGYVLFGVGIRGSYPLLLLFVTVFLLDGLGQGVLISTVTRTQQVAFIMAVLSTLLPTFILSGFVFPIREMPRLIQAITYLVPARYFLTGLRGVILKGSGFPILWPQLAFLAVFGFVVTAVSILRMKKEGAGESGKRGPR